MDAKIMAMPFPKSKYPQFTTSTPTIRSIKKDDPDHFANPPILSMSAQMSPTKVSETPRHVGNLGHKIPSRKSERHVVFQKDDIRKSITFSDRAPLHSIVCRTPTRSVLKNEHQVTPTEEEMQTDGDGGGYPMEDFLNHSLSYNRHRSHKVEKLNKSLSMPSGFVLFTDELNLPSAEDTHAKATSKKRLQLLEFKLDIMKNTMDLSDSITTNYKQLESVNPGSTTVNCINKFDDSIEDANDKVTASVAANDHARSLLSDSTFFNSYRIMSEFVELKVMSTSHFAVIYRAKNRWDGRHYCLKRSKSEYEPDCDVGKHDCTFEFINEITALSSLTHENIVRYYSSWREMEDSYIQLELCRGGSLFNYLWPDRRSDTDRAAASDVYRPTPSLATVDPTSSSTASPLQRRRLLPAQLRNLLGQLTKAVVYLQARGILHADIKPSNILVDIRARNLTMDNFEEVFHHCLESSNTQEIVFKLSDFGRACLTTGKLRDGDGRFLPLLTDNSPPLQIALGRDVYAMGVTLFEASGGDIPEYHTEEHRILKEQGRLPSNHGLPGDLIPVVQRMVLPQAKDRLSINDLFRLPCLSPYVQPTPIELPSVNILQNRLDDCEMMEFNQFLD